MWQHGARRLATPCNLHRCLVNAHRIHVNGANALRPPISHLRFAYSGPPVPEEEQLIASPQEEYGLSGAMVEKLLGGTDNKLTAILESIGGPYKEPAPTGTFDRDTVLRPTDFQALDVPMSNRERRMARAALYTNPTLSFGLGEETYNGDDFEEGYDEEEYDDSRRKPSDVSDRSEFKYYTLHVNRVAKVTKGGKRLSFLVTMVAGNGRGTVGLGTGKASEVPVAQQKAMRNCLKNVQYFPRYENRTVFRSADGKFLRSTVKVMARKKGFGVTANNKLYDVMEAAGITDVSVKCIGSRNPMNMVKACLNALGSIETPQELARKRGMRALDTTALQEGRAAKR